MICKRCEKISKCSPCYDCKRKGAVNDEFWIENPHKVIRHKKIEDSFNGYY